MVVAETAVIALVGKAMEKAADALNDLRKESRADRVAIDDSQARSCLMAQMRSAEAWASSIPLQTLLRDKQLRDSFVDLSLDVGLTRHTPGSERRTSARLGDIYAGGGHVAILGRPGAGKTTSLQRIAELALGDWQNGAACVPVLVRLRDLRGDETLVSYLLARLGIDVRVPQRVPASLRREWELRAAVAYVASISATLLVDGLDETRQPARGYVETEIREFALAPGDHRLFLTCRTADFDVHLQHVQAYTIRPLSAEQVTEFAHRWLGPEAAGEFLRVIEQNPYAGTEVVPLTLAHLCALYERHGELPPRPIDVYEQIVGLLVEDWDKQRGVHRASRYADFSAPKKQRFLQAVAYELSIRGRKGSFREEDLRVVYGDIAPDFNLPRDEEQAVIREVESHTGLVHQSGYRQYDFVHLVIQEFLMAMHAHRKVNAAKQLIPGFPNEMALVIAHSAGPDDYLEQVLHETLQSFGLGRPGDFVMPFLARLAIERPLWRPTPRSGWVFITYLDLVTRHSLDVDRRARLRMPAEVVRLLRQPGVEDAIAWAAAEADRYDTERAFRLIPRPHASLPPFVGEYVRGRADAGMLLLRSDPLIERLVTRRRKAPIRPRRG